jgi:ubiquitin-conjugating enzyme E2 D/E
MNSRRVLKEFELTQKEPIDGISISMPNIDNCYKWHAIITGPEGTPYAGGQFHLELSLPAEYPIKPPEAKFLTKIYHPNVSPQSGHICLDILQNQWSPALTISKVLLCISCLMDDANPASPLNGDAGRLMSSNRPEFNRIAQDWTTLYAINKK